MSTPYKANIKIVPNNNPNSDGEWVTVDYGDDTLNKIKDAIAWDDIWKVFEGIIPDNYHIVQIDLNAKLSLNAHGRGLRMT